VRSNDGTPEGTATVSDGVDGCTITITGGSGSCTLALTTVGDRTLTATFQGNASFATSSANEEHRVNPAPPAGTTTTITSDTPDPSEFGQTVTVGFTVFSAGGTPTGTVQISDGVGGGCTTDVSAGSCNYAPAGIGTRIITATYSGSSVFSGSTDTEEHTVNRPPTAAFTAPNCTVGQQCQFTDASNDPDGEIASRAWSFEGGTPGSSTLEDPSVTFATEGPKTVTLTVTDDDGAANTVAQPVTVAPAPGALGIRSQPPQRVESGDRLEPEVELLDGGRNAMALKGVQVSVRIASALGDVRLDGETTRPTDEKGRARFENLRVRGDEDDSFVLAFSAPGFSPVDSQRISIEDD
jgi:hypothetical protein